MVQHSACAGEQDSGESRFDTLHRLADDRGKFTGFGFLS